MYTKYYNAYMNTTSLPVLRAREQTRKNLKIIAALTGESMLAVLDRLVQAELERVQHDQKGKQER
jgi:hypothetical protein